MSNDREREMRLKAAELHGAMPSETDQPAQQTVKIVYSKDKNDPIDYTHLRCDGHTLLITTWRKSGHRSLSWVGGAIKTVRDIDAQTALLQEARRVMTRDGQGGAK